MDFSFLSGIFANPWSIIRSLIDISIVAYVIYRLLGLIRGTRAEQLLKGLVILLVVSILASSFRLELISWLLDKLWIIFAITLPIVFQPELRRILEQLGRGTFFAQNHGDRLDNIESIAREIGDAAGVLSRNKVGALIVLGRDNDIEEYMDSGVNLDSLVTSRLLVNIFVPNTPLHDGAVFIRQGRIDRAACFLPLSDDPSLDKDLGTRHRAGIGITEVSDAIAVMVSEETGAISVAEGGKINRHLDALGLKNWLLRRMVDEDKHSTSLLKRRWPNRASDGTETEDHRA